MIIMYNLLQLCIRKKISLNSRDAALSATPVLPKPIYRDDPADPCIEMIKWVIHMTLN